MNDDLRLTDQLLHDMFERRAQRGAADGLRGTILASARVVQQQRGTLDVARPPLRLLAVAALLAVTAGGGLLLAGKQDQAPVRLADESVAPSAEISVAFTRPFTYRRSDETVMGPPIHEGPLVGFAPGHSALYPITPDRRLVPGARGIAIAPVGRVQRCPDDGKLQPRGDVEMVAGLGIGGPQYRAIDGRRALIVWPMPEIRCAGITVESADVLPATVGSGVMPLYLPSRLYVTIVDGQPIVFQVWATSLDELAAWLPAALRFMDGVHFISESPIASGTAAIE